MADEFAIVPVETLQPDQARTFVIENKSRLPNEFTMFVSLGKLFMGQERRHNEAKMIDAIMQILEQQYSILIERDDPMMRIKFTCKRTGYQGQPIEGPTIGGLIG